MDWKMWQTSQKMHQPSKFPTSQFELTHWNKSIINVAIREPFFCQFTGCFWWMQHAVAPLPSPCASLGGALVLYWTFDSPIEATTCKIFLYLNPQWGYLSQSSTGPKNKWNYMVQKGEIKWRFKLYCHILQFDNRRVSICDHSVFSNTVPFHFIKGIKRYRKRLRKNGWI